MSIMRVLGLRIDRGQLAALPVVVVAAERVEADAGVVELLCEDRARVLAGDRAVVAQVADLDHELDALADELLVELPGDVDRAVKGFLPSSATVHCVSASMPNDHGLAAACRRGRRARECRHVGRGVRAVRAGRGAGRRRAEQCGQPGGGDQRDAGHDRRSSRILFTFPSTVSFVQRRHLRLDARSTAPHPPSFRADPAALPCAGIRAFTRGPTAGRFGHPDRRPDVAGQATSRKVSGLGEKTMRAERAPSYRRTQPRRSAGPARSPTVWSCARGSLAGG